MAPRLEDHLEPVLNRIRAARHVFVFSDFDGTLVPIVNDPMCCVLSDEIRTLFTGLNTRPSTEVGIVSGRDLADLQPRIGVPGLAYAGNHGLEIESRLGSYRHPIATEHRPHLDRVVDDLTQALKAVPGAWVQHKGLSATVHFRQVEPEFLPQVLQTVGERTPTDRFTLRRGKAVLEVRPAVDWNKGRAVAMLMERESKDSLAIYMGDDETDEDAFRQLDGQITVLVGDRRDTAAAYRVQDSNDVHAFIRDLSRTR